MRRIPGYAVGSYYKLGSPLAGLNANPMRGLVYLVTNQRKEPIPSSIQHPLHPGRTMMRLETPASAYAYVADIVAVHERDVRSALGITKPNIALVPIPAANVVRGNRTTDRWPSRDLALELERLGFGKVRPCVVHKDAMRPRFSYEEDPAHDLAQNLVIIGRPMPNEAVVYVDDIVTSGDRVAAIDQALGQPPTAGIVTTALSEEKARYDAYKLRTFALGYDPATSPWKLAIL
ncbi:hypothetical protein [Polyangium sp. 6x1]|uniref:hypothetical protein n=1 Tax=Polyangium sp. 6x1 TaxID=3042689 RepID=UPI0024830053|nr:hypothetical protein [Polyangium sp. 6x1]MDI1451792.1 hypothetical protein [Polyangium sp. 6x1]